MPLDVRIERVAKAGEIARLVGEGDIFNVAIFPGTLPNADWWALWGELCLLNPRPAILVYARAATFELWTSVLDLGGYDVIVEPFSELEIQEASCAQRKVSETGSRTIQDRSRTSLNTTGDQ